MTKNKIGLFKKMKMTTKALRLSRKLNKEITKKQPLMEAETIRLFESTEEIMKDKSDQEQVNLGFYIITQHLSNFDEEQRKAIVYVIADKILNQ